MHTDGELGAMVATMLDDAPAGPPDERVHALRWLAESERRRVATARRPTALRRVLPAAAAVAAMAAGFVVATALDRGDNVQVAGHTEYDGPMRRPDGAAVDAHISVVKTGIGRVVELQTDALPILPTGEFYELWFVGPADSSGDPDRISAGTFHPDEDGRSDVKFAVAVDPALKPVVMVTAEPGDGDPEPSGNVVLRADVGSPGGSAPDS